MESKGAMAAKKKTIKGTNRNYIGSNSSKIVDVIKVYGNGNTVKARNGKDQITVYQGKKHKIFGDAGVDTIYSGGFCSGCDSYKRRLRSCYLH